MFQAAASACCIACHYFMEGNASNASDVHGSKVATHKNGSCLVFSHPFFGIVMSHSQIKLLLLVSNAQAAAVCPVAGDPAEASPKPRMGEKPTAKHGTSIDLEHLNAVQEKNTPGATRKYSSMTSSQGKGTNEESEVHALRSQPLDLFQQSPF